MRIIFHTNRCNCYNYYYLFFLNVQFDKIIVRRSRNILRKYSSGFFSGPSHEQSSSCLCPLPKSSDSIPKRRRRPCFFSYSFFPPGGFKIFFADRRREIRVPDVCPKAPSRVCPTKKKNSSLIVTTRRKSCTTNNVNTKYVIGKLVVSLLYYC